MGHLCFLKILYCMVQIMYGEQIYHHKRESNMIVCELYLYKANICHGIDPANIIANAKKQLGQKYFNTEEIIVK